MVFVGAQHRIAQVRLCVHLTRFDITAYLGLTYKGRVETLMFLKLGK
jgi:hypothetical protein